MPGRFVYISHISCQVGLYKSDYLMPGRFVYMSLISYQVVFAHIRHLMPDGFVYISDISCQVALFTAVASRARWILLISLSCHARWILHLSVSCRARWILHISISLYARWVFVCYFYICYMIIRIIMKYQSYTNHIVTAKYLGLLLLIAHHKTYQ